MYKEVSKKIISDLLKENNKTQEDVALMLGTSQQNFSNKLRRASFRFTDILEMLDKLDYDLEFKKRNVVKEEDKKKPDDFF